MRNSTNYTDEEWAKLTQEEKDAIILFDSLSPAERTAARYQRENETLKEEVRILKSVIAALQRSE